MDYRLYHWINTLQVRTSWAQGVIRLFAADGIAVFIALLIVAWWLSRIHGPSAVAGVAGVAVGGVVALGTNQLIGKAVDRARPYVHHPAHLLVSRTTDFSFPSDHAMAAGAVAMGLLLVNRRLGVVATLLALGMAFARVYVGAHYPGDVVAGLAVGGALGAGCTLFFRRVLAPVMPKLARGPLGPLLAA